MKPKSNICLSLLVCTRNGATTITDALKAAKRQVGIDPSAYEILVIDNGSVDDTPALVDKVLEDCVPAWRRLMVAREGKLNAFLRGVQEARAELIAVVDDDNIIAPDFVSRATEFFGIRPDVGLIGSANKLDGSAEPEWFDPVRNRFACGTPTPLGDKIERLDDKRIVTSFAIPPGAGSCFRRRPLIEALEGGFFFLNDGLRGTKMMGGEDTELCFLFNHLGWQFGIDAGLRVNHRIHPERLDWSHALRLCRSTGAGGVAIDLFIAQNDGTLETLRGRWWWLAARHYRRLANSLPRACLSWLGGRRRDPIWFAVNTELGALSRLMLERTHVVAKAQSRATKPWARQKRSS